MIQQTYSEIYDHKLTEGAILHTHIPFIQDYLTLHILLKKYNPRSVFEVGTHIGEGTKIICNAVPKATVFSLDLPVEESEKTLQHPKLKNRAVGELCDMPYLQVYGDSLTYKYPLCDAWFIDGEHDYDHPYHETIVAIRLNAKLIIWHDADMPEVYRAITDAIGSNENYELYRVLSTRIAYAVKK